MATWVPPGVHLKPLWVHLEGACPPGASRDPPGASGGPPGASGDPPVSSGDPPVSSGDPPVSSEGTFGAQDIGQTSIGDGIEVKQMRAWAIVGGAEHSKAQILSQIQLDASKRVWRWAAVNSKHGKGTYVHRDGTKYVGEWKKDLQHGDGIETWSDGVEYRGQYVGGRKHGQGKYFWSYQSTLVC